jgi:hypothetical protein
MKKNLNSYFVGLFVFFKSPLLLIPAFASFLVAYFAPLAGIATALFLAVILDFFTGIWAAKKRGEKIRSHVMRNSVVKLLCYCLTILFCFVVQNEVFVWEWAKLVNLSTALIILSELKSILENFGDITENKIFNNIFKAITSLFNKKNEDYKYDDSIEEPKK